LRSREFEAVVVRQLDIVRVWLPGGVGGGPCARVEPEPGSTPGLESGYQKSGVGGQRVQFARAEKPGAGQSGVRGEQSTQTVPRQVAADLSVGPRPGIP